jgi:formylglycine-generating enzyme required for sulfatase activity
MTRIFISHSHSDREIAEQLVNFLLAALEIKEEDIRCTSVPGHELSFGMSIEEQLKRDLGRTVGLIALITKDSLRSTWVLFELGSSWAMEKLVVPILGPGLTYDDLPGPLKNYPVVRIEDESPSYRLTDVINQLASTLDIPQKTSARRDASKDRFLNRLRAWKSSRLDPDTSQQEQIEELTKKLEELDKSYKKQLQKAETASQQEKQKLEQNYQKQRQELQSQIEQLEGQLEQERSQQNNLQSSIEAAQAELAEKESENAQLLERISRLHEQLQFITLPTAPSQEIGLKIFKFDVVKVNAKGQEVKKESKQAQYYAEDLGNGITLDMVAIPGGKFLMGTKDGEIERLCKKYDVDYFRREKPQHEVTVQPFFMGKYPVTQSQWREIASRTDLKVERDIQPDPSNFKGDDRPVEQVSWYDVIEFCARLSKLTGREYRLPSEAEWEHACRAGTTTPFYFGETITGELANYNASNTYADEPEGEYRQETTPVGQFPPNGFGLYDMHGQVWEWCADTWHDNYEGAPNDGSAWLGSTNDNDYQVLRGGSWYNKPQYCRSADRDYGRRGLNYQFRGFRVVCVSGRTLNQ